MNAVVGPIGLWEAWAARVRDSALSHLILYEEYHLARVNHRKLLPFDHGEFRGVGP